MFNIEKVGLASVSLILLGALSCAENSQTNAEPSPTTCRPGTVTVCSCPNGRQGSRVCDAQGTNYSSCECSSESSMDGGNDRPLDSGVTFDATPQDVGNNIVDSGLRDSGAQAPFKDGGELDSGSMTISDAGNTQNPDSGTPLPDAGSNPLPDAGSTPIADAGNTPGGNTISVSGTGLPASIPSSGSSGSMTTVSSLVPSLIISDINIRIDLSHGCTKDLVGTLTSPSGRSVIIFDLTGLPVCSTGPRAKLDNTIFDDEGSVLITRGSPPFSGTFQPTGSLSDFDGENAEGVWTLLIEDNMNGDRGTLHSWSLELSGR